MIVRRHSKKYNFLGNSETGITFRWGRSFQENPILAPWPELADISISNHCSKGCRFCYRDSKPDQSFMPLTDYKRVLKALTSKELGPVFQVALGGGEPTEHPEFIQILEETSRQRIVPNYTTNAENVTDEIIQATKRYCGAIAVSLSPKEITEKAEVIKRFIDAGVKVNVHFILSNSSMSEAINILEGVYDSALENINAIIFLTFKPFGRASSSDILLKDADFLKFVGMIDCPKSKASFGFDACFVPELLKFTQTNTAFVDSCECGYFSVYIDEKMNVKPCSFTNISDFTFNLNEYSFEDIWANKFRNYRDESSTLKSNACNSCRAANECRGGCYFFPEINLCK